MSRRRIRKRIDAIPGVRILKLPGGVTAILGSGVEIVPGHQSPRFASERQEKRGLK
jgi:hypothetical protein